LLCFICSFPLQVQFEMKVLFYPFYTSITTTAIVTPILNNDGKDNG
jgi:hypothetical protein